MFRNERSVGLAICVAVCAFSVAAFGQSTERGVVSINGGRTTLMLDGKRGPTTPANPPDAGLVTIYSNLGTGNNVYDGLAGTGVLGRNVPGMPYPQWSAFAFVPSADHVVTEIQVGVTYVQGPNTVVLSLNADNSGLPGQTLHRWTFNNLPVFGSCCTVQTGKLKVGVPVTKGTTYWVVLRTEGDNQGTWDVWNNDSNGVQGKFSNNLGSGWVDGGIQQQGAFGVFGQ